MSVWSAVVRARAARGSTAAFDESRRASDGLGLVASPLRCVLRRRAGKRKQERMEYVSTRSHLVQRASAVRRFETLATRRERPRWSGGSERLLRRAR